MIEIKGRSFADVARRTPMAKQIRQVKPGTFSVILHGEKVERRPPPSFEEIGTLLAELEPPGHEVVGRIHDETLVQPHPKYEEVLAEMRESIISTPFSILQVAAHLF